MRPAAERQAHPHQRWNAWHYCPSFHAPMHLRVSGAGVSYFYLSHSRPLARLLQRRTERCG
jgi:hypothetical protein